jgi:hypothetical protein
MELIQVTTIPWKNNKTNKNCSIIFTNNGCTVITGCLKNSNTHKETENSEGFTLQQGLMTLDPLVKKRRKSQKY